MCERIIQEQLGTTMGCLNEVWRHGSLLNVKLSTKNLRYNLQETTNDIFSRDLFLIIIIILSTFVRFKLSIFHTPNCREDYTVRNL